MLELASWERNRRLVADLSELECSLMSDGESVLTSQEEDKGSKGEFFSYWFDLLMHLSNIFFDFIRE